MKRISVCIALILIFSQGLAPAAPAEFRDFPCGGGASYSVADGEIVRLSGQNCSGPLVLDKTVKVVGDYAFYAAKITSLIVPDSVISIGENAFTQTQLVSQLSRLEIQPLTAAV